MSAIYELHDDGSAAMIVEGTPQGLLFHIGEGSDSATMVLSHEEAGELIDALVEWSRPKSMTMRDMLAAMAGFVSGVRPTAVTV